MSKVVPNQQLGNEINISFLVKPIFEKGFMTKITNLSSATNRVDTVDACTDTNMKTPATLHTQEYLHLSET